VSQLNCPFWAVETKTMEDTIKKTFLKSDGMRKVNIFQREDKTFGFEELEFGPEENSWYPVGRYSLAIIDSFEHALREAQSRVQWLADSDN
ncbi:MAG TPA: hypothetical protein VN843_02875, partial [Anaerolineales bacterium]|nr:hypothetical protein [Anaerolineales bacterium]